MIVFRRHKDPSRVEQSPDCIDGVTPTGGVECVRQHDDVYVYVHLRRAFDPRPCEDSEWMALEDGWECCVPAPRALRPTLLARHHDDVATVPEVDREGRVWPVPLVLEVYPRDGVVLPVPLGRDWLPEPLPWQRRLIGAARWMRAEILSAIPDLAPDGDPGPVALELDCARAAAAVSDALCSMVAIPPQVLQRLAVLDHAIISRICKTVAGVGGPVVERVAASVASDPACDDLGKGAC
jgi:hypothetical protein